MNTIEQILKKELKLSDDMCSRFLELVETKHLKKKELFVQQGKVCYSLGIIESGVLRSYIEKMLLSSLRISTFPVQSLSLMGVFLQVNQVLEAYRFWKKHISLLSLVPPTVSYSKNRVNGLSSANIFLTVC